MKLQRGSTGTAVKALQIRLIEDGFPVGRWGADGSFGAATEAALLSWLRSRGLPEVPVVTDALWSVMVRRTEPTVEAPTSTRTDEPILSSLKLVQARNYAPGRRRPIRLITMHTAEIAEVLHAAESLAGWSGGPNAPHSSWGYAVDADSISWSVRDTDTAWHAPGVNDVSIGIEIAGRAAQTAEEWADSFSARTLTLAAGLVRELCARHSLPVRFAAAEELREAFRAGWPAPLGLTDHRTVSRARLDLLDPTGRTKRSTHTDPGPNFPWDRFLQLVKGDAR